MAKKLLYALCHQKESLSSCKLKKNFALRENRKRKASNAAAPITEGPSESDKVDFVLPSNLLHGQKSFFCSPGGRVDQTNGEPERSVQESERIPGRTTSDHWALGPEYVSGWIVVYLPCAWS